MHDRGDVYTLTISITLEAAIHPTKPGNERLYKQYLRFGIKATNNIQDEKLLPSCKVYVSLPTLRTDNTTANTIIKNLNTKL